MRTTLSGFGRFRWLFPFLPFLIDRLYWMTCDVWKWDEVKWFSIYDLLDIEKSYWWCVFMAVLVDSLMGYRKVESRLGIVRKGSVRKSLKICMPHIDFSDRHQIRLFIFLCNLFSKHSEFHLIVWLCAWLLPQAADYERIWFILRVFYWDMMPKKRFLFLPKGNILSDHFDD